MNAVMNMDYMKFLDNEVKLAHLKIENFAHLVVSSVL